MRSANSWAMSSECVDRNTVGPAADLAAEQVLEQADAARVEADGRLVHDQHARLVQQGGGEDGALLHAVRVALGQVVHELAEAEQVDHLLDALPAAARRGMPYMSAMNWRNSRPVSFSYR